MMEGSVTSLHLSAESSQETISEARKLLDKICQMLVASGYFRARIPKLQPFDKMLGGSAWCITMISSIGDSDFASAAGHPGRPRAVAPLRGGPTMPSERERGSALGKSGGPL